MFARRIILKPSVVIAAAAATLSLFLWVRSYLNADGASIVWSNGNQLSLGCSFGAVNFRFFRLRDGFSFRGVEHHSWNSRSLHGLRPMRGDQRAGFQWSRTAPSPLPGGGGTQITALSVPLGAVSLFMLALLIAAMLRSWRHAKRLQDGVCSNCGYDLTGNLSGVCSECGVTLSVAVSRETLE